MVRILIEGDYHCGDYMGLTPPGHRGELEEILAPMWDFRERELEAIGPVDIHVIGGDNIEGPGKKQTVGIFTTNLMTQAEWANECIERVKIKQGGERRFCFGTDYHVFNGMNMEEVNAKEFDSEIADYQRFSVFGKRFSFRHFCGRSDVERGQYTQVAREITSDLLKDVLDDYESAHIHGRHHVHYWSRVGIKDREGFTCPAWKLPIGHKDAPFTRKLRGMYYDVGYVLIEVERDGEVFIRKRVMKLAKLYPREFKVYEPIEDAAGSDNGH